MKIFEGSFRVYGLLWSLGIAEVCTLPKKINKDLHTVRA